MAGGMEVFRLVGRIVYEGQQQVEQGLTRLGQRVEGAQKNLEKFGEKAKEVGEKTKEMGDTLTEKVSLPLLALGGFGLKTASDMQEAYGMIQAQTGLTKDEIDKLYGSAKTLWKQGFGESIEEAGQAVATVTKGVKDLGLTSIDIEFLTKQALILKDAFGYEVNESTRAAASLMRNFGVDGSKAMDLITVGAQKGGDYSGELLDTINEYSPQFKTMGMSAEQMFNLFIQGAKNGAFNLDKTADAVKEFNIRAQDGSQTTQQGFSMIGLNAKKMGEAIAAGGQKGQEAFVATVAALAAIKDPVKQNIAGVNLFGTQWEDLRGKVVTSLNPTKDMLGEVEGATKKAGDSLNNNFGHRVTVALRTLQAALEPLGNVLMNIVEPAINSLATKAESLANWFGSLTAGQQKFIVILGIAAAAVGPLLVVLGSIIGAIGSIATAIAAIGLVTVGWIAGIALLVAALGIAYAKVDWFRNGVNAVFSFLWGFIQPIITDLVEFFKAKFGEMQQWWATNGAMIQQAFQNVWSVIQTIIRVAIAIIMPIVTGFIDGVKNIISGGLDIIMGVITFFAALFTGHWSKMWDSLKQILFGALQLIWGLFETGLLGKVFGIIGKFVGDAGGAIGGFVSKIVGFFTGLVSKGKGLFTDLTDTVLLKVMYGFDKVGAALMRPIEAAAGFIGRQIEKIKGFFTGLHFELPHIKLPHFNLSGSFSLSPPRVPHLSIDWYKAGGVFGGPTVIGVGEEPGVSEAVIPLKPSVLKQIGEGIAAQMGGHSNAKAAGPIVIQLTLPDSRILARFVIDDIDELLQRKAK